MVDAKFPEVQGFLFKPSRYKVLYGGRAGSKSWGVARALLLQGAKKPLRVLCTRETQTSIADSVHKLLSDQVDALKLGSFYKVTDAAIRGKNGTEFIFAGLRQNINNLKSYESVDICWVEEAHTVSKKSWDVLIPTIRKEGSEIWVTFNPELDTDETYKRFILSPPSGAKVVKMTWRDNPWLSEVSRRDMEDCKARDEDDYNWIWEGLCKRSVEGAIYQREMAKIDLEGRVRRIPYEPIRPVDTYWDIGDRFTKIVLAQSFPFETRVIDYFDGEGESLAEIVRWLQSRNYVYGVDNLPWDAKAPQLSTGKSIQEQLTGFGRRVRVIRRFNVADGINMVRTILPQCWFDSDKCADLLTALRRYRWAPDGANNTVKGTPLHDIYSHGADSFRSMAVAIQKPEGEGRRKGSVLPSHISPWS